MYLYRMNREQFEFAWSIVLAKLFTIKVLALWLESGLRLADLREIFRKAWVEGRYPSRITHVDGQWQIMPGAWKTWIRILSPVAEGSEAEIAGVAELVINNQIIDWCERLFASRVICEHCRQKLGTADPAAVAVKGDNTLPGSHPLQYAHASCVSATPRGRAPSPAEVNVCWTVMTEHPNHLPPTT